MSDMEDTTNNATTTMGEGERAMTNKEKRKALQAEKRAKREQKDLKRKRDDQPADPEAAEGEEEEAVSHKEQRRRRKLEKAAKLSGEPVPTFTKPAALPPRSTHSVWVGNLSFSTDADKLKDFLVNRGIEGITRVHMPRGLKRFENNRGFAYVDLPSGEMVAMAVGLTESALDGRKLLIKSGSNFEGRPVINADAASLAKSKDEPEKGKTGLTKTAQKVLRAQKNPPAPTLFLGNLSFNSTEETVRALFENAAKKRDEWKRKDREERKALKKEKGIARKKAEMGSDDEGDSESDASTDSSESESESGSEARPRKKTKASSSKGGDKLHGVGIRNIRMGTFEDSGKCKGWAFVDFFSSEYATASLIDPRTKRLDGRDIKVEYAGADAVRRGTPKSALPAGGSRRPKPFVRGANRIGADADRPQRYTAPPEAEVDVEALKQSAPAPGTFDPAAPLPKKHKETQEERRARRTGGAAPTRRARPGAALANAKRENVGIVQSQGTKISFD